MLQVFNFDA